MNNPKGFLIICWLIIAIMVVLLSVYLKFVFGLFGSLPIAS